VANEGRAVASGPKDRLYPPSVAVGVGNNEHAIAEVRGTKGGRWYAFPLRIVPEGGQVSENVAHPPNKEPWDVLQEHVVGS
jgi:hypothetical protein